MMNLKGIIPAAFLLATNMVWAQKQQGRVIVNMNSGWEFAKQDSVWQMINLPHTWNKEDVLDDEPGYYRDVAWYRKRLKIGSEFRGKELALYFEGVNQETEVFINGKKAARHIGGYTGFSVPATTFLQFNSENEIRVKVNNRYNKNIPPLTADFTFYGGIYRDVYLTATSKVHFSTDDHGSNGVYITTPAVSKEKADISIKSILTNNTNNKTTITLLTTIINKQGKKVAEKRSAITLPAHARAHMATQEMRLATPALWSPERPDLYTLKTAILDEKGGLLDLVSNPLGFRWFAFDAEKGFILNGRPYKLIGASRHQDHQGLGNAVPDSLAVNDVLLLKKMGANFLRIAHYPQDPCVVKACDSLGIIASIEIPIVNEITQSDSFYVNCELMLKEMIRQNFNHPSVVMWCYMNEVLLRPHSSKDNYIADVTALAQRLEKLAREEDPYRVTMMANHGNLDQYKKAGLLEIPMVVGWNLYSGWYGGSITDFPVFLDKFHQSYPRTPFMVTEYGADADPRIRSAQPVRFDKSIEYTTRFHQYYFTEMMKRPFVAGSVIWNLADFNSETRNETMPHMNNKGLLEWDRKPKDPYYFYQAVLSDTPFIKILGSLGTIQITSNLDSVAIKLNNDHIATIKINDGLGELKLSLPEGTLTAEGKGAIDSVTTGVQPQQINVMLGANRFFIDKDGKWWQPAQAYQKGSWGYIGGNKFTVAGNGRLPYGTDKNIKGTDNDPLYQTQQTGIQQYRLDVPPGKYELTLHFAELLGESVKPLPYNLNDTGRNNTLNKRIFNVQVNGQMLLDHFDMVQQYGMANAVIKSTTVSVTNGEGIYIDFSPVQGEPVLNALQLKKLDTQLEK